MKWWKIFLAVMVLSLACGTAFAAPSVKLSYSTFTITEGVNDDILAQVKAEMGKVQHAEQLGFVLRKITNDDLAKLCAAYPEMRALTIDDSKELTSIAPVAGLKGLRYMALRGFFNKIADATPLAGLTELLHLELASKELGPDLKWMSGMTKLTKIKIEAGPKLTSFEGIPALPKLSEIIIKKAAPADLAPLLALPGLKTVDLMDCTIADLAPLAKLPELEDLSLHGAAVKDFSPLAACPKLKKVTYTEIKNADYNTLGTLTQVQELRGGGTKMTDISWVANLPNLKTFNLGSELVEDFSPLAKTKVENFDLTGMKTMSVDLASLAGATSMTRLRMWGTVDTKGFEALGTLVNLKELYFDGVNEREGVIIDLAFAKSLASVEQLELIKGNFANAKTLAGFSRLTRLKIDTAKGEPFDLAFLAKNPDLTTLIINNSAIANIEGAASCQKLKEVTLTKVTGVKSLAFLKKLPALKTVTVSKGAFPEAELSGFGEKVKVNQR
ncbi:hypothetical protein LJB82_02825 [Desulfovibrio sp. OttesenSCG-928-M16]|nr:hypothetical protein [Desulfovibrio sp. OttesenSCG-928-M16]